MKIKFLTATVFVALLAVTSASAQDKYVQPTGGGSDDGICASGSPCLTVAHALSIANPGDIIILLPDTYTEGGIDIDKDFITIQGPYASGGATPLEGYNGGAPRAGPGEATFDASLGGPHDYVFGIEANNVTIDGIEIDVTGNTDVWSGIKILEGGWDRWTIRNNRISEVEGQESAPGDGVSNRSFGIYGDAQTTNGSDTMTGGLITDNYIFTLGNGGSGSDISSGVGIYLEGIEGEDADCDYVNQFTCGVWIYDNVFEHIFTGKAQVLQGVTTPGGKEYSYGIIIAQDDNNILPNNGAWIGGNADLAPAADGNIYYDDDHVGVSDPDVKLEIGVSIGIGGSTVNEDNADFTAGEVVAYVLNDGRKATIEELALADFYKTFFPRVFGEGSDMYFADETEAKNASNDEATIVHLEETSGPAPTLYRISVEARGTSASYKVSLDSDGDLNVRQGARLLFDGALSNLATDGVTEIVLDGTAGEDLLTVDFNNGNPTPMAATGIDFDGMDGFDRIVLRGDEQLDYQAIVNTGVDSGTIMFEPTAGAGIARTGFTSGTTTTVAFDNLEPIDDLLIVNEAYSVVAPNDVNNEVNVINGPFRFGFDTFQINSGQNATFEEINFANKKNVHIYGSDDTGSGDGNDVFTLFTEDGDAPDLLLSISMYGGDVAANADASDDYFVVRPSKDFIINVDGGSHDTADWFFIDCALTDSSCEPNDINTLIGGGLPDTYSDLAGFGFQDINLDLVEESASLLADDITITKELVGFAQNGAHPGDDLEYKVTVTNNSGAGFLLNNFPVWVTDVIDHRLSLVEQSVVAEQGTVQVVAGNTAMLWKIDGAQDFDPGDTISMTYTVIVNTLITTEDINNYASLLNDDDGGGATDTWANDFGVATLDVLDVFGFPVKAAIQASLFYETEAGPRYMVGLYAGAKDPAQGNIGSMLCRVPDTNQAVGWDGGLGNLWYSCGEGLPAKDGLFSPLVVTDLYQDSAGRIWLSSWGFDGLYYSDDGGQTWTSAMVDLSGGQGGAPDGNPDGFAQIYAITEDILGTLYISANNGDVYRSFDRGVTWQKAKQLPLGSADTAYSLEADPTVPGRIYAGTFGDSLYVTTDFAETWDRPDLDGLGNGYIFDIEVDPISGNLFVGTAKGIFYSPDGGDNWSGLNSAFPFPTNPPEIRNISFDVNGALFASTWGQGVWSSLDWQANWLSEFALKAGNVMDISISNGFVHILTDTGATFRFAYDGSSRSVDTEELDVELPNGYALEQNYPNPFNPTTSIAFSLPQSAQVNLTVYDVLGRRVATLVNGQLAAGQHQVQFEASSLPSGMYLYRLSTPTGSITQKMMLLK